MHSLWSDSVLRRCQFWPMLVATKANLSETLDSHSVLFGKSQICGLFFLVAYYWTLSMLESNFVSGVVMPGCSGASWYSTIISWHGHCRKNRIRSHAHWFYFDILDLSEHTKFDVDIQMNCIFVHNFPNCSKTWFLLGVYWIQSGRLKDRLKNTEEQTHIAWCVYAVQ